MYKWVLTLLAFVLPAWSLIAPIRGPFSISCLNKATYSSVNQDGATGTVYLSLPQGASGWTAEVKFSFPVKRMTVWDSSGTVCSFDTCRFSSASWKRNLRPGETVPIRFEIGFEGFDAPKIERIVVNNQVQCSSERNGKTLPPTIQGPSVLPKGFSSCGRGMYKNEYQDGADGTFLVPFPRGARGWEATVFFSFPVTRLEVWDGEQNYCTGNVCTFKSASWARNVPVGGVLPLGFDIGFKGFDAPSVVKIVVNNDIICDHSNPNYNNEYPDLA